METAPVLETEAALEVIDFAFEKWSERRDSNPRPLVPQTSALTGLRHAPMPFP